MPNFCVIRGDVMCIHSISKCYFIIQEFPYTKVELSETYKKARGTIAKWVM